MDKVFQEEKDGKKAYMKTILLLCALRILSIPHII